MSHRDSVTRDYSETTSPSQSPPSSPTSPRVHPFYQHPSGSRFAEHTVSAVLSSETGSNASSLGSASVRSTPPWGVLRTQPSRLQKLRRAPQQPPLRPPFPVLADEIDESDTISGTWTMASTPTLESSLPSNPISFYPASHPAESFTEYDRLQVRSDEIPSLVLLRAVAPEKSRLCNKLLQTCLPSSRDATRDIMPRRNGFVHTVIEAYSNHRGLIVRPDDVWLAIMTQFSFFVNGHAGAFREVFIPREGNRELVIEPGDDRYTVDAASIERRVTALMEEQIGDPSLRDWIVPSFTTTTTADKTTCAIVMMGTAKDDFPYEFALRCGIPQVTLEGEKRDWQIVLHRLERLKKYGIQTIAWYHLLRPVLSRFVNAYDHPGHPDNLDFWNKIVHQESGSGPRRLSGWITAFCVFSERGEWRGDTLNEERIREHEPKKLLRPVDPLQLTPSQFVAVYVVLGRAPFLALDGFPYPAIDGRDVPCGYACLDVTVDDRGEAIPTAFVGGSVGAQICSTEKTELFRNGLRDTVRPVPAWWHFVKRKVSQDAEEERGTEA